MEGIYTRKNFLMIVGERPNESKIIIFLVYMPYIPNAWCGFEIKKKIRFDEMRYSYLGTLLLSH